MIGKKIENHIFGDYKFMLSWPKHTSEAIDDKIFITLRSGLDFAFTLRLGIWFMVPYEQVRLYE